MAWLDMAPLQLDGIFYSTIGLNKVPVAFCDVDVKLIDNGEEFDCMMVSGLVASSVNGEWKDTMQPLPARFMINPKVGGLIDSSKPRKQH